MRGGVKSGLPRNILKLFTTKIVVERHSTLSAVVRQKNVNPAIAVVVQKTCSRTDA
jgi:hypothetical protein